MTSTCHAWYERHWTHGWTVGALGRAAGGTVFPCGVGRRREQAAGDVL